ncbi:AI-2E family transporter [Geodermatophilus sp. YIM 151500]|uniref:AI-2E family transporter n=1 Tax=Geodermatophilus sp. YIM 151500 TaxID=2984531 RepID=UPI0021E4F5E2|nr:AI-2E family transporter [Geodermatophilus sp. YIM 151500]MCV2487988.1 AI-2E family transporter [Geodermatophilus sp. YIM 151500]
MPDQLVPPTAGRAEAETEAGAPRRLPPWFRRAVVFVLVAVAVYQAVVWAFLSLRGFLGLLFLAWLFAVSIEPVVDRLARRGLRRGAATGLVLLALVLLTAGFVAAFGTLLVAQLVDLVAALPDVVRTVVADVNLRFGTDLAPGGVAEALSLTPERLQDLVGRLAPGVVGVVTSVVGVVFQFFTFLLFGFYMSAQGPALRSTVSRRFPPRQQQVIATVWRIAVDKTGGYVLSRLVLAVIASVVTGIALWVLDVPFWLPLALWTGLVSQFVPTIGTYLAIVLPALVALAGDPLDALWVVVVGTVYQQVENYLVAPRVTARTVAIHPAVAFGAVIVGTALFGPLGALVSIPVVAAVEAVVDTYGHRYELVEAADGEAADQEPDGTSAATAR